jgi:RNA polymerase sigma factor (sigma-70 family)
MADPGLAPVLGHIYQLAGRPEDAGVPDGELLRRLAQHHDQAAFEAVVRRHGALVWRVCRRTAARADLAEDAFQATFMVLARRAAAIRKPAALASWLHGVAYRIARRARMYADRCPSELLAGVPDAGPDPAHAAAWRELGAILEEEVQRLPERLRAPLLLCYWEGESNKEAARRLGWPCGTVKTRLARARRLLHTRLVRRGVVLPAGVVALLLAPAPGPALAPSLVRAVSVRAAAGASARVAALAEGLLPAVCASRLHLVLGLLLALGTAAGVGGLAVLAAPAKPLPNPPAAGNEKPAQEPTPTPRADDPLPEGAVARLGTGRFRHGSNVWSVAFSPNGKVLASGGSDGVRSWDVATGKQLRMWHGFPSSVESVAFSPDGGTQAAAADTVDAMGVDNGIGLLNMRTGATSLMQITPGTLGGPVLFSPDGKTLVGSGSNGDIVLCDPATGRQEGTLHGNPHPNYLRVLALSPDGKTLASPDKDGTIPLWDVARRKVRCVLKSADNLTGPVAFSADGKWLFSAGGVSDKEGGHPFRVRNGSVRVWDVATGKVWRTLRDPSFSEGLPSLAVAPDGRTLAISGDGGLALWDEATGKRLRSLPGGRTLYQQAWALRFSPDGKLLAGCVNLSGAVYLWETASGRLLTPRPDEAISGITSLAVARDGRLLATLDGCGTVGLWDLAAGRLLLRRVSDSRGATFCRMALSPDGKTLAVSLTDGGLGLWEVTGGSRRLNVPGLQPDDERLSYMAFSPDGTRLVSASFSTRQGGGPRTLRVWDPAAGKLLQTLSVTPQVHGWFDVAAFSPDNRCLTATTVDGETYRWRWAADRFGPGEVIARSPPTGSVAYSPDGLLAAGDAFQDGVMLWDLKSGRPRLALPGPNGFGRVLAFSPDGRYLASGAPFLGGGTGKEVRDHTLRVYELATGQEVLRREPPPDAFVGSLTFAADSRTLVTGLTDSTVVVWDLFPAPRGPDDLPTAWDELANVDGRRAHRALASLVGAGDRAVELLSEHLEPARRPESAGLAKLLAEPDSDRFEVRKKANNELAAMGELARPALERARANMPSAEVRRRIDDLLDVIGNPIPAAATLRRARAVAVLEHVGSPSARRLLGRLAEGAPESRLTQEAKASLRRLAERAGP